MNEDEIERRVAELMRQPYTLVIQGDSAEGYFALVRELPGCMTAGKTEEEALANLKAAMAGWLAVAIEDSDAIPAPQTLCLGEVWPDFTIAPRPATSVAD